MKVDLAFQSSEVHQIVAGIPGDLVVEKQTDQKGPYSCFFFSNRDLPIAKIVTEALSFSYSVSSKQEMVHQFLQSGFIEGGEIFNKIFNYKNYCRIPANEYHIFLGK